MAEISNGSFANEEDMDAEDDDEEGGIRIGDIYIPPPPPPACTFDFTGPRLIITHIENYNFKSYAGKQVMGPLHKSFSAIVGPNGSGKSNVIDSMLFVFGYRAQKIRSKKISVLIHKSKKFPDLDSCTVKVFFQKIIDKTDEEFDTVPDSEIVVSRTANKDNSSWYSLNGRRVPFKEVASVLRTHGIDIDHNRFLILQGEVEQIAMMKPKAQTEHETGMLEYLEDLIGSSRFKKPIDLLSQRIEELNDLRTEKLNRVKVVEKEKDDLEGPKNEAMEYLKLENQITIKKNVLYQKYKYDYEVKESVAKEKRDAVQESMKDLLEEMESIKRSRTEKETEYKKQATIHEQCMKEKEEFREQYSKLERDDLEHRENLKHSKSKAKKLEKSLEAEQQKLQELRNQPEKLEKEIEELQVRQQELETQLKAEEKKLAEVLEGLREETKGLQEEKDIHEAELMGLKKAENEAKSKLDLAKSELHLLMSGEENEKKKLQTMTAKYDEICVSREEVEKLLKDAEKRIPALEKSWGNTQKLLAEVSEEEKTISAEVRSSRLKVEEARSSMQANRSQSQVLQSLMKQKEEGKIPGIMGRLGDLGAIAEEYDVAISTACPRLDNIVTDTMDTAQKCVEFLKRHNVGVATFIALDKMEKWIPYTKQRIETPENVPRLFDLVQVRDERILPAFYFSLQNTLVAKDLQQATRIGLQGRTRYKVVTLKGELIEVSGTMSGGGGRPMKGKMGKSIAASDVNPEEVEAMVRRMGQMTERAEELRRRIDELYHQEVSEQKELTTLKNSLPVLKMKSQALKDQASRLAKQLEDQKARVEASVVDKTKQSQLQAAVDVAKKEYESASGAAGKVHDIVKSLHKKIMEITEGKMGAAQRKVDALNGKIDTVASTITKNGVTIKTSQRNAKKCEDKIASLEKEIQETGQSIEQLKGGFAVLEEKAKTVMEKLQEVDKKKDAIEVEMEKIALEVKKIRERDSAVQSSHVEVKNELDKHNGNLQEAQRMVKHWQKELKKLTLQEIDGETNEALGTLSNEELEQLDSKGAQYSIALVEQQLKDMKPNMAAIQEYRKKEAAYLHRVGELEEVTNQRDTQRGHHDELKKNRLDDFMKGFVTISNKLKEMYQMITLGGDADLELVDTLDPFSEGIVFSVRPPKKSWKSISNLSGGEKTLSSLALVFALHYYRPSPLYVMDEIDAALDFRNVSIVGNYIKERTKNAQFIIISLRNNMFELADRLIGIYKTYDCTKTVTINPDLIAHMDSP